MRKLAENPFGVGNESEGDDKSVFEPFAHALLMVVAALLVTIALTCVAVSAGLVN